MIKVMAAFRLTADRSADEASEHYLTRHVPLVTSILRETPGALGYVQNRVRKADAFDHNGADQHRVEPLFDWLVEFWFASRDARLQMARHPRMAEVMADHPRFMNVATLRTQEYYVVDEHVALWSPELRANARTDR